jgi:hypothetical protein
MSQLVPYLNFGLEDSQSAEGDYLYGYEPLENSKMVSDFSYQTRDHILLYMLNY